jgi:hypothetical protein
MKNFCIACGHEVEARPTLNSRFFIRVNREGKSALVWRCESCNFFVRHEADGTMIACRVGALPVEVPEGVLMVAHSEQQ